MMLPLAPSPAPPANDSRAPAGPPAPPRPTAQGPGTAPGPRRDDPRVTDWALAAGGGDQRAAELFVRATYDDVRRFIAHLTAVSGAPSSGSGPGGGDSDDLTQETYLRALGGLSRFAGRSCARSWLLAIARHVVADRHRRSAARPRISETADWIGAADRAQPRHAPGFEETVALSEVLGSLDRSRRHALLLTGVLGLSYAEAGRALGCPVGTVRSRVARARRDVAREWAGEARP